MNVVFICNELPPAPSGGIGAFVNMLAPEIAAMGHTVNIVGVYDREYDWQVSGCTVLAVKPRVSTSRRLLQKPGFRKLTSHTFLCKLCHLENCRALRDAVMSLRKPDAPLLVEWPSYQGQCNWSAPGIYHLLRIHGATFMLDSGADAKFPKYRESEISTARNIENWIGVTQWSIEECRRITGKNPKRSSVIHNPVQRGFFIRSHDKPPELIVLYAGTLCENKGDDRLAVASNSFLTKVPKAKLVYMGRHTKQRADYIRSLIKPGLQNRVEINDSASQSTLAEAMRAAAVFVMPSRVETFGMVYAEAMAAGLPVVGGNGTGIPEVVPDGKAGFLVDVNDIAAISQAVERLLASASLRREMGERGRRIATEHYTLDACVRESVAFYEACLKRSLQT